MVVQQVLEVVVQEPLPNEGFISIHIAIFRWVTTRTTFY